MGRKGIAFYTACLIVLLVCWFSPGSGWCEKSISIDLADAVQAMQQENKKPSYGVFRTSDGKGASGGDNGDVYGGWGGFSFNLFFPDLSGFQGMTEERGLDGFSAPLRCWSGRGFMVVNNFRLGGMLGGGHFRQDEIINDDHRWAELDIFWGGFTADLLFPVTERVDVFGGGMIGGGALWMSADGDDLGDYWSQAQDFGIYIPEAGLSYKVTDWMRVEATAQYNFIDLDTGGSSFYAANGEKMVDASSMSGPVYSIWFMFGYQG
ncbi:MAG: hypothetical protein R6V10_07215 [bacterium]